MPSSQNIAVPASQYSFEELAEIYNQSRVDYIVPMPMNARRMQDYVHNYDISLANSVVATTEAHEPLGIAMLGIRQNRAWITRLGVSPVFRERRVGSFIMATLIDNARAAQCDLIQLEVIVGNDPARRMFEKFGFVPTRELLVIRRPPKPHLPGTHPLVHELRQLSTDEIYECLNQRDDNATWVEESASLLNGSNLHGIHIRMGTGGAGWAVFMSTKFQIQHIVLHATEAHQSDLYFALLYYIHELFPNRDTIVENIPENHPCWQGYHALGYVVSFRRTEMLLAL